MNGIGFTVIKGVDPCKWCDKAIALLQVRNFAWTLDVYSIGKLRDVAKDLDVKFVPIIYHGMKFIGGYADLREYLGLDADD